MNIRKIAELISKSTSLDREFTRQMVSLLVDVIARHIEAGHTVTLNRLGRFYWKEVPARNIKHPVTGETIAVPKRLKLKFSPATRLRRSIPMSDNDGMEKYGVVLDDKSKEASKDEKGAGRCPAPGCGEQLDNGGACPTHGTEPQEKRRE